MSAAAGRSSSAEGPRTPPQPCVYSDEIPSYTRLGGGYRSGGSTGSTSAPRAPRTITYSRQALQRRPVSARAALSARASAIREQQFEVLAGQQSLLGGGAAQREAASLAPGGSVQALHAPWISARSGANLGLLQRGGGCYQNGTRAASGSQEGRHCAPVASHDDEFLATFATQVAESESRIESRISRFLSAQNLAMKSQMEAQEWQAHRHLQQERRSFSSALAAQQEAATERDMLQRAALRGSEAGAAELQRSFEDCTERLYAELEAAERVADEHRARDRAELLAEAAAVRESAELAERSLEASLGLQARLAAAREELDAVEETAERARAAEADEEAAARRQEALEGLRHEECRDLLAALASSEAENADLRGRLEAIRLSKESLRDASAQTLQAAATDAEVLSTPRGDHRSSAVPPPVKAMQEEPAAADSEYLWRQQMLADARALTTWRRPPSTPEQPRPFQHLSQQRGVFAARSPSSGCASPAEPMFPCTRLSGLH
eukprot:TRINITY_DN32104_c0_g1_i1.p1 TRINITY_DN32104_c0_g1~~TRINITY_DN32104_c0_g1_i1.p1  ORF type:complete len:497 (-),score=111.68 TRINITY_DN32104_c0_g1_i1:95-1585(-)